MVELHPRIGYRIVEQVPALRSMTGAILHHHERFDGDGLPLRAARRGDPARGARGVRGRLLLRHDLRSPLPRADERRGGLRGARALRRDPVRPARGRACSWRRSGRGPRREDGSSSIADGDERARGGRPPPRRRARARARAGRGLTDNLTLLYSHRYLHETAAAAGRARRGSGAALRPGDGRGDRRSTRSTAATATRRATRSCAGSPAPSPAPPTARAGPPVATAAPASRSSCPNVGLPEAERLASELAAELAAEARAAQAAAVAWQPGRVGRRRRARAPARPWTSPGLPLRLPSVRGACAAPSSSSPACSSPTR